MQNKKKNFLRGLTFMELMIVVAIIGIMSAVTLINLGGSKSAKAVEIAARQVAGAIRQAQSFALSGKQAGSVTVCGWGFHFDNDATSPSNAKDYQIFYNASADCALNDNKNYTGGSSLTHTDSVSASLQNSVNFEATNTAFYFSIPFGTVYKNGISFSGNNKIVLSHSAGSAKYTVCVYSSGRVEELQGNVSCP